MKTFMIFAMAMVSMFSGNANAAVTNAPATIEMGTTENPETTTFVYKYKNETMLNQYDLKNGEVISKTIYKWNADAMRYKPCMKYTVSKNADTSILSCGYWDENTKKFSINVTSQTFSTSEYPRLLVLPSAK